MESVTHFIEKDLQLTINQKKSKVCGATLATFLRFHIQNLMGKLDADQASRRNGRFKNKLRKLTIR